MGRDISRCRSAARDSKLDAALPGFYSLTAGQPLTIDYSSSHNPMELQQDLAARQVEHCLEAWNYLSQALFALMSAQDEIAIHLAYYSEVRSANSLFSSSGIALKNHPNYYLHDPSGRRTFGTPTHLAIREMWPIWCQRADAVKAFDSLRVAPSVTLEDISQAMGIRTSHTNTLMKWGYELVTFGDDHKARNLASYNIGKSYSRIPQISEKSHGKLLAIIWEHLTPTGRSGEYAFEKLYAEYLIWCYCLDYATNQEDEEPSIAFNSKHEDLLELLSHNTGLPLTTLQAVFPANQEDDPRFLLFDLASSSDTAAENIVARALILARIATNKLNSYLESSRCEGAIGWIGEWLKESGIIEDAGDTDDAQDSASEIHEKSAEAALAPLSNSWEDHAYDIARACRLQLVLCWGFSFDTV